MPNRVEFSADEHFVAHGLDSWMPALAEEVLHSEGIDGGALSVFVTDDETVRDLNRDYRGYDQPTDVLSFGLSELAKPATDDQEPEPAEFVLPPDSDRQLGEVVISYPTGERQAVEHGRPVDMELAHLLIHGILHLLGYDHYEPEEEREMRSKEERLLALRTWERARST
jgi:probable rRNA maturation factor